MPNYKHTDIRHLRNQLVEAASQRDLWDLADRVEQAIEGLKPENEYGYRTICRRLNCATGELNCANGEKDAGAKLNGAKLNGADLIHDLRLLAEDLSDRADVAVQDAGEPVLTVRQVSRRYNVSTKTVDRWRDRGLVSRRFRFGKRKRVGFLASSVERFAREHAGEVERGTRFSQMTDAERSEIVEKARVLAQDGFRPAQVARQVGEEFGRSAEAIRLTVKSHDADTPDRAVFPFATSNLSEEKKQQIFRRWQRGEQIDRLTKQFCRSKASIVRIVNEMRARQILDEPIEFVDNNEFDAADAAVKILGPAPDRPQSAKLFRPPAGIPPYLASLYRVPLLTKEQEVYYFRKMNYLKFRAAKLSESLDAKRPAARDLDQIENLLKQAAEVKNLLIRRNLRLVVSICKKYVRPGNNFFELISDGNMSLMRAIEKFDYSRGFKLSTYATWAVRKNFARSIPAEYNRLDRFRTGNEELFHDAADDRSSQFEEERTNQRQHDALMTILRRLNPRERDIIVCRFGLDHSVEPLTLEEVGQRLDVSKERIRQLEKRALGKLKSIATEEKLDIPGI